MAEQITAGDADDFRKYLVTTYASEATVAGHVKCVKHFFRYAHRKQLIALNPFVDIKGGRMHNSDRQAFIPRTAIDDLLEQCPDAEWRLIIGLCRFGGLRCPSEVLRLRWQDIDWDKKRFLVTSSKTKKQGKGSRVVPLFPELEPLLTEAFEQAAEGATYCITRYRDQGVNLRTQLLRYIKRAGLDPWPRLFQNFRSSRETELAETYPIHVVTAWLGNTPQVAEKHYLQVTDEHFADAAGGGATSGAASCCNALKSSATAPPNAPLSSGNGVFPDVFASGEYAQEDSNLRPTD